MRIDRAGMIFRVGDPASAPSNAFRRAAVTFLKGCIKSTTGVIVLASTAVASVLAISWLIWSRCSLRSRRRRRRITGPSTVRLPTQSYSGLENVGNSCYLNATLQSLASLSLSIEPSSHFHAALAALLHHLNVPNQGTLSVNQLVKAMGGSGLASEQQDAHEFLQAVLGVLSKHRPTTVKASPSVENMYPPQPDAMVCSKEDKPWEAWEIQSVICGICGRVSDSGARISQSSMLVIPPSASLQESLQLAFLPDHLSDYYCSSCMRPVISALSSRGIVRWPLILIAHVQRTLPHGKDETWMQFPLRFCAPRQDTSTMEIANQTHRPSYELMAVIEHRGGLGSGHYVAYRRVLVGENRCRWLFCSDSSVGEVALEQVLAAQAYILFYKAVE